MGTGLQIYLSLTLACRFLGETAIVTCRLPPPVIDMQMKWATADPMLFISDWLRLFRIDRQVPIPFGSGTACLHN